MSDRRHYALNYVLFQSKNLVRIQRLLNFLNNLAVVLPIITLLLFAGAVALTRNRRKGLVRAATGLALSTALILVLMAVGRNQYIAGLKPPQSPAAASGVVDTVTANLSDAIRIILFVSALVAIGTVVAGNAWVRRKVGDTRKPGWVTGARFTTSWRSTARSCSGRSWPSAFCSWWSGATQPRWWLWWLC